MAFRLSFLMFLLLRGSTCLLTTTEQPRELSFTIEKTWNGEHVSENETVQISLSGEENSNAIRLGIKAPFYGDPAPMEEQGKPFLGLWNYEVVQVFFLNDDNQYLEVEIGPYGQHIVLLMDGQRNTIRHSLPLNVTTTIEESRWTGEALIPGDYFPSQVTKFNAYALNGVDSERQFLALYSANDSVVAPDLHNLAIFQPLDFGILNNHGKDSKPSLLWESALQGIFKYEITRQWNDFRTNIPPTRVTLQGFESGVEINYTIPINEDPYPAQAFVVVFENEAGEAVKLQLHVDGSYLTDLLVNRSTRINVENLLLDYRVDFSKVGFISGSALVLPTYFPPHVKLVNMYALFGVESMIALSLQPINVFGDVAFTPDLNSIEHFTPIDFDLLVESNLHYSDLWKKALNLPLVQQKEEEEQVVTTAEIPPYEAVTSTEEATTLQEAITDVTRSEAFESEATTEAQTDVTEESITTQTTEEYPNDLETVIEEVLNLTTLAETKEEEITGENTNRQQEDIPETQTEAMVTSVPPVEEAPALVNHAENSPTINEAGIGDREPVKDQSRENIPRSQSRFIRPLRFLLRRNQQPKREDSPRRFEDSKSDQNELPLTFQITIKPREQAVQASPSSPKNVVPEISLGKEEKPLENLPIDSPPVPEQEEKKEPEILDLIPGLLPPPHPICFTEGLVPHSFRCQLFYECVIEDGSWVVYRWRCKRGFYYDHQTVACLRGIC